MAVMAWADSFGGSAAGVDSVAAFLVLVESLVVVTAASGGAVVDAAASGKLACASCT